jgi:Ser-tRNA(Ala) deacylase AlaX
VYFITDSNEFALPDNRVQELYEYIVDVFRFIEDGDEYESNNIRHIVDLEIDKENGYEIVRLKTSNHIVTQMLRAKFRRVKFCDEMEIRVADSRMRILSQTKIDRVYGKYDASYVSPDVYGKILDELL